MDSVTAQADTMIFDLGTYLHFLVIDVGTHHLHSSQ